MSPEEIRKFAWEVTLRPGDENEGKLYRLLGEIAAQLAEANTRANILASICGDSSGPHGVFCTLEPKHRGEHKHFHSSGGAIGWRNRE